MKQLLLKKTAFLLVLSAVMYNMQIACTNAQTKSENVKTAVKVEQNKPSDTIFKIISIEKDSVKFEVVADTKFYSLELISGDKAITATSFSNLVDTVYWANGSQFWPGSEMGMPAQFGVGAMKLKVGAVMRLDGFDAPKDFKPAKVRFTIEENGKQMVYNIASRKWEE